MLKTKRPDARLVPASRGRGIAVAEPGTPSDQEAWEIGQRLRYYRKSVLRSGPREVAEAAGIAPGTLRSIEAGDGTTKLSTLLRAIRFGYRLEHGLPQVLSLPRGPEDENPVVRWSGSLGPLPSGDEELQENIVGAVGYYLLRIRPDDPQMEVAVVRLPPARSTEGPLRHRHGGDEIMIGIKGVTELVRERRDLREREIHTVRRGELILYRGSLVHWARNPSPDRESVYLVIRAPVGLTWPTAPPLAEPAS